MRSTEDKHPMIATLNDAAVTGHEVFMSWVRAGFTRDEAMQLLIQQLRLLHECPNHTDT